MAAVLVTGGLGVNGAWVTRQLVEQGKEVVTYSRHKDTQLVEDIMGKFHCIAGDILDLPNLIQTIKKYKIEHIFHLAAVMPDPLEKNPFMTYRINVDGTINIYEAARLMNIKRVVYTSSAGVYDAKRGEYGYPTYKPIDEDYPRVPLSVYGTTKVFTEDMGLFYSRIYGIDIVILRFSWIYGLGKQARHGAYALHSKIIESAMLGKPFKIPQGGDEKVDMIYCRDVANSILLAGFAKNLKHRIFNIGTGKGETFTHLIEIVKRIFNKAQVEIGPGLDPIGNVGPGYSVLNIDRASRELGFRPQYDLETGVKDYVNMMKHLNIEPVVLN